VESTLAEVLILEKLWEERFYIKVHRRGWPEESGSAEERRG